MGRVDQHFIGKRQELAVQRIVELGTEVLGRPPERRSQVGPADIADKQCVPGEDRVGLRGTLLEIEDQDRD